MILLVFFAFLSGIVTILSPCILPVLPIVLSGSVGGRRKPAGVILGFIVSFSVFTLVLSTLVRVLNIPPDSLRIAAVILIISFGLIMLIPKLMAGFEIFTSKITSRGQNRKRTTGFTGGLITGTSLGLVWTPCVGPIIASVISLAITQSIDGGAVFIILAYSMGTAIPMLAIMLGGRSLIMRFPVLSKNPVRIQRIFGILLIIVGFSLILGLDRKFQSAVLNVFPQYGSGLTAFENIESVQNAIKNRRSDSPAMMMAGTAQLSFDVEPENGKLNDYGPAPELITNGKWINAGNLVQGTDSRPVSMNDLKGKVVLLDFWTYSCVNCIRTIPHLKALYDAYGGEDFEIIGVHTPEFAFERSEDNVQQAVYDLGINWPVLMDNDYQQWNAYKNRYWPAHYFIDAEGRIRYFHFGEGEYDTAEDVVRALLQEAGTNSSIRAEVKPEVSMKSRTGEIYLGYSRSEGFLSEEMIVRNKPVLYSLVKSPGNGEWSLKGNWTIKGEYIAAPNGGELELGFNAKNIYLVIEPRGENEWIEVMIDNKAVNDTRDVHKGALKLDKSRLYQIGELRKPGKHILKLKIHGEPRLFAFTFG